MKQVAQHLILSKRSLGGTAFSFFFFFDFYKRSSKSQAGAIPSPVWRTHGSGRIRCVFQSWERIPLL